MTAPLIITITLITLIWLAIWANVELKRLESTKDFLVSFRADPTNKKLRVLEQMARKGMESTLPIEGVFMLRQLRAESRTQLSKISSAVEAMTQIGLLGTVVGVMIEFGFQNTESISGIGIALVTTLLGIVASLATKSLIEVRAFEHLSIILEFLEDERITDLVTHKKTEQKTSQIQKNNDQITDVKQNATALKENTSQKSDA